MARNAGGFAVHMVWAYMRLGGSPIVGGTSGGSLDAARLAVPAAVRLGPDRLEYVPGRIDEDAEGWWRLGNRARGALNAFARLAVATNDAGFVRFAERYGVLGLTATGLPCVSPHVPGLSGPETLAETWHGFAVSWEPIPAWRVYAQNARAVMHLATRLRLHSPVDVTAVLSEAGLSPVTMPQASLGTGVETTAYQKRLLRIRPSIFETNMQGKSLAYQRGWLAAWVTREWLGHAALTPAVTWGEDVPELHLPVGASDLSQAASLWPDNMLFNVLAAQLAAFLCSGGKKPSARCAQCREPYQPAAWPRPDRANYCPRCGDDRKRERDAKWARESRAKQRAVGTVS